MDPATPISIQVPGPLRRYCGSRARLELSASTVRKALEEIGRRHPSLHVAICDETGRVRRHVNLFVNSDDVRDREGLDTALAPGDVVTVLPAVSGG